MILIHNYNSGMNSSKLHLMAEPKDAVPALFWHCIVHNLKHGKNPGESRRVFHRDIALVSTDYVNYIVQSKNRKE